MKSGLMNGPHPSPLIRPINELKRATLNESASSRKGTAPPLRSARKRSLRGSRRAAVPTRNREPDWFTVADLVKRWSFSPAKIRRFIREGRLAGSRPRPGQAMRVTRTDVIAFEKALERGNRR
jgi:hypothetical protein